MNIGESYIKEDLFVFSLKNVAFRDIIEIGYLVIPENKVTCIVGKSGSGKTTLLKLLNNLISPDKGDILHKDKRLEEFDPVELRRRVVMLPQVPVIFPGTIRKNLLMGIELSDREPVEDRVLVSHLKGAKVDKDLDSDASKLSGGEKQRLALCRITLMKPEVLLLDEPSSALDDGTEELIIESMVSFARKESKTLVMVTHSKRIARTYGEYIVSMDKGKVVQVEEVKLDERDH